MAPADASRADSRRASGIVAADATDVPHAPRRGSRALAARRLRGGGPRRRLPRRPDPHRERARRAWPRRSRSAIGVQSSRSGGNARCSRSRRRAPTCVISAAARCCRASSACTSTRRSQPCSAASRTSVASRTAAARTSGRRCARRSPHAPAGDWVYAMGIDPTSCPTSRCRRARASTRSRPRIRWWSSRRRCTRSGRTRAPSPPPASTAARRTRGRARTTSATRRAS